VTRDRAYGRNGTVDETSMTDSCSILRRNVGRAFSVEISPDRTVGQLKPEGAVVTGKMAPKLDHVDASDLGI